MTQRVDRHAPSPIIGRSLWRPDARHRDNQQQAANYHGKDRTPSIFHGFRSDSFLVLDKLGPERIQTGAPPRSVYSRTDGRLNLTRPTLRWWVGKTPTLWMLFYHAFRSDGVAIARVPQCLNPLGQAYFGPMSANFQSPGSLMAATSPWACRKRRSSSMA